MSSGFVSCDVCSLTVLFSFDIILDTYLSYLNYLNQTAQIEEANKVLWRASKAVEDNDAFSQRYREMLERGWVEPTLATSGLDMDVDMDVDEEETMSS